MENTTCSTTKPCMKSCLISLAAVFIFMNLYGMLVHGHLLMDDYKATANLWLDEATMQARGAGWMAYYLAMALVVTCWFKKVRSCHAACHTSCATTATTTCCPIKSGGLCFGVKLGLVMGLGMGSAYLYMPIPVDLAVKWFFAGLLEGIGIGCILGMLCKKKNCQINSCETKAP